MEKFEDVTCRMFRAVRDQKSWTQEELNAISEAATSADEEWLYAEGTSGQFWGEPVASCALAHLKDGTIPRARKTRISK